VEEAGRAPTVACGRLRDAAGATLAADPLPAETALADLADHLHAALRRDGEGEGAFALPLVNARFAAPLHITVTPAADNGAGWTVADLPPATTLRPGEKTTLPLRATWTAGTPRYPLPEFDVRLAVGNADDDGAVRTTRLALPLVGARPQLRVRRLAERPDLAGDAPHPLRDRPADVADLGRMDLERGARPATTVRLGWDDEALHVAFACHEPNMEALRTTAAGRDGAVFGDDAVEVLLDADGDGKDYLHIAVNSAGTVYDAVGFDRSATLPGLAVRAGTDAAGWTVDLAIPWAAAGVDAPPREAGILLARTRRAGGRAEVLQFPVSPRGNHRPDAFARLVLHNETAAANPVAGAGVVE
ncbi:MAG: carbohydrate-binding family 9-like protein, partial [Planctomycetota bacterium]